MNFKDEDKVKYLIENSFEPIVFTGLINDWHILKWTLKDWETQFGDAQLKFRKHKFIKSLTPIWEQTCEEVQLTMKEFIAFTLESNKSDWLYFDYKYMKEYFQTKDEIFDDITWKNFGFPEMSGKESTIWIGSCGSHTPCHVDTYGCNLIAQVYGRKQWIIFPPEENLKPTRVPYEESSIYSKINFFSPNVNDFRGIRNGRSIILNPGDVLFLPPRWWHYVENLETAISVNVWLPKVEDDRKRLEESIVQLLVSQITKDLSSDKQKIILNPNSTEIPEMPLTGSLSLLETVTDICKKNDASKKLKSNVCKPFSQLMDMKSIFKENSNIKIVPKLSDEEFMQLIKQQEKCFTNCDSLSTSTKTSIVEKLINSLCHPEIVTAIAEKLLKE